MDEKMLGLIAMILLVVGGLNWGLVGLINLDLVALICGKMTIIARIVYILVGAAAVYEGLIMAKILK